MRGGRWMIAAVTGICALLAGQASVAGAAPLACGNQNPLIRICASSSVQLTYPGLFYTVGLGLNLDADPSTCEQLHVTSSLRDPGGSVDKLDEGNRQACGAVGDPPTSTLFTSRFNSGATYGTYAWKLRARGLDTEPPEYAAPSSAAIRIKLRRPPMPGNRCDTAENLELCASGWVLNPDNTFHILPAQIGEKMAVSLRVTDLGCSCNRVSIKIVVKRPDGSQLVPFGNLAVLNGVLEEVEATFPGEQSGTYVVRVNLAPNLGDFTFGPKVILKMDVAPSAPDGR